MSHSCMFSVSDTALKIGERIFVICNFNCPRHPAVYDSFNSDFFFSRLSAMSIQWSLRLITVVATNDLMVHCLYFLLNSTWFFYDSNCSEVIVDNN